MANKTTEVVQDELPEAYKDTEIHMEAPITIVPSFEMVVDSPKSLWDAIGHIQFKFIVNDYDTAMVKINESVGFWMAMRDEFKELFIDSNKATPAQLQLLTQQYNGVLPEGMDKFTKDEASAKIRENIAAQRQQPAIPAQSGSKYSYKSRQQTEPTPGAPTGNGPTEAQLDFIYKIAKRKKIQVPAEVAVWGIKEASEWINANK